MTNFLFNVWFLLLPISTAFTLYHEPNEQLFVKRIFGGMRPPQFAGWEEKITIFNDGSVIKSVKNNFRDPWQHTTVSTLSANRIIELKNLVANLQPGELTFPNEEGCTDTPITTYAAKNRSGMLVEFAQTSRCLTGRLTNFPSSQSLKEMLDSFRAL